MKPAQILAAGLLFFLLFMPVFSYVGDLRVECELSEQDDCSELELTQSIAGVCLLFGFILSVGGAFKMRIYVPGNSKKRFCSKCGATGAQNSGLCFVCDTIVTADFPDLVKYTK